jgi:hypothetical protein
VVTVARKVEIAVAEGKYLVIVAIPESRVVSVAAARTALVTDAVKEGSFVRIRELVMAELKEVSTEAQVDSVAVGRIVMKTVGTKVGSVAETTKRETVELQWRSVADGKVQQVVVERKLIVGSDLLPVAVEQCADFVAERTGAAG